jgi:hypothetical protein
MPSCDVYVHDAQVPPRPSHDVETKPTLLETYFFGGSSSTSRHYFTSRKRVGNPVDHQHYHQNEVEIKMFASF